MINTVNGQPPGRCVNNCLLVGNTLSLFEEPVLVEKTMDTASRALVPRGVLLVHVIDFDHLRAHPVRIKREGSLDGGPVVFEKRIDADDNGAVITITVTMQAESEQQTSRETQRLHEWGVPLLRQMASRFGLELREELGGMDRTPRVSGRTKDVVLVCERQERLDAGERP